MAAGFLPISASGALRSPYSNDLSSQKLLDRICSSLDGGGFPASAGVVSELNAIAADPRTAMTSIAEIVLHDPTLALRIVHHVNKEFFPGEHAVTTVSEAVLQLGIKALCEQCSTYVLLQKFVPSGKRSGAFSAALRKMICSAILTSKIMEAKYPTSPVQVKEFGFILGTLYEIGPLLLAFHYPQAYDAASTRAKSKGIKFDRSLRELVGYSGAQLSAQVAEKLSLHTLYNATFCVLTGTSLKSRLDNTNLSPGELAMIVEGAAELSTALLSPQLDQNDNTPSTAAMLGLSPHVLTNIVAELPAKFRHYCNWMQINLASMPLLASHQAQGQITDSGAKRINKIAATIDDLHKVIESGEPLSSVITGIMEAFRDLLGFDRVLYMQLDLNKHFLKGRLFLGKGEVDPSIISRKACMDSPERTAMLEARPVFEGQAMLEDAVSFTAVPVGYGQQCIGILYADHRKNGSARQITQRERAAVSVFAELLDRALAIPL